MLILAGLKCLPLNTFVGGKMVRKGEMVISARLEIFVWSRKLYTLLLLGC